MNIENDFLTDFDLFGKVPELYYKGRSKKSSTFGIILTVIYIVLYIAFLIYKLVRMFKRVDMTFYDSYTFNGLPSIKLTNNEFFGGFGMGGIIDERMYYLTVEYVSLVSQNGEWVTADYRLLETEECQLEWFGSEYQEIFADQPLHNYYCIKDVSGMVLEGYSNLERYSYFNVKFYPCANYTKNGTKCYDYWEKYKFFAANKIELKIQDNYLNPEDYKNPVTRRRVDMNSPVFKDLYQMIYSYLQIVNIETDEDITGLNFFTDHTRKQIYTRYEESFIIASPLFYGDILISGAPIADATLQLAAKVLTEKRQYLQLIDVLGDVGGLMEIVYTVLNLICSFVTEILYDKSLVNNLFPFDLNKKYVVFNNPKMKIKQAKENKNIEDIRKIDTINLKEKIKNLENNQNIEIYTKENSGERNIIEKSNTTSTKTKAKRKKKLAKKTTSKTTLVQLQEQNIQNENIQDNINKLSIEENKNVLSIYNGSVDPLENQNGAVTDTSNEKDLKNIYISNWLICCFWCSSRKRNVNKVLFEEGSKLITERLDIMNMFNDLYIIGIMQQKLGIDAKGMNMSDRCKNNLQIYNMNNGYKTIEN